MLTIETQLKPLTPYAGAKAAAFMALSQWLAENIADDYGRRDLLKFGVRPDNLIDPPCVVGLKN